MLRVSKQPSGKPEVFYSLQGEGPTLGTPSVFLRLATCNLACTWCDTKYTWDWAHYDFGQEMVNLDVSQVEERILSSGCRNLVITGGEPLLQQNELAPLVVSLKAQGFRFEVETNGTQVPIQDLIRAIDQWNVSPKLANSGNPSERREVAPALESFSALPNAYFKFVVAAPGDLEEVRKLRDKYHIPNNRVILMPEGQTADALKERSGWISEVCVKEEYRFGPRLHILLWGDQRGR